MNKAQPSRISVLWIVVIVHMALLVWASQAPVTSPQPQTSTSLAGQLITPTTTPVSPSPTPAIPKKTPQAKPETPKHKTLAPAPVATKTNPHTEKVSTETESSTQASAEASTGKPTATETTPSPTNTPTQNNNIGTTTPPRSDAKHLNNPAPTYPTLSKRLGEQGQVLLNVHILANGSVNQINIRTSSGHPRLDEAALTAVQRWVYIPAKRGDQAIDYWYIQPISFVLN